MNPLICLRFDHPQIHLPVLRDQNAVICVPGADIEDNTNTDEVPPLEHVTG